jgi:hypothetical protein
MWNVNSVLQSYDFLLGVYVDVFGGCTPKPVLARHYTDYSPRKLKEI